MPTPSAEASYEILRTCYLELIKCGIITSLEEPEENSSLPDPNHHSQWQIVEKAALPPYAEMVLSYWMKPSSAPKRLGDVALKSAVSVPKSNHFIYRLTMLPHLKGLSGRTLRRLPALALALYTESDPCSMDEALYALSRAVDDEFAVKGVCETLT